MSLIDIEQNDVDISQLFAYKKEITLLVPGTTDEITFYQRIVGDADNNRARVYGLRESATFREDLKNPKWEDRLAYLPNITKLLKDELINVLIALEVQDLSLESMNETSLKQPKEPAGDASLEEQEEYQKKVDSYKNEFNLKIMENLEARIERRQKELEKLNKDVLREQYEASLINRLCQERFGQSFLEMSTYFGTYTDKEYKTRAFKSFDDFLNAPTNLKDALISNYSNIQLGGVTLKKLQEVTP